ncbi:MAG: pyridoxamine 5'-phosphate oxidase family protein [Deltaproteobacteria bacterium]|jgi:nitroimidazol reductase NimA-like FMN-containing flavoprotein (pyridoxamine 5'-phosphate oxidase superfamily)|nr:pyridoxamine 5'-phosphate oxidase family protein [Deltaproteobacteria bacterium]
MEPRAAKYPLSQPEIEDLLNRAGEGVLGTLGPDGPYTVPLNFVYWNGKIYFHSRRTGQKLRHLASDDRVCFTVWEVQGSFRGPAACTCSTFYQSVIIQGRAVLADPDLAEQALLALARKYAPDLVNPQIPPDRLAMTAVVEITPLAVTGKYCRK